MYLAWRELKATKGRFTLVGVVISLIALLTTLLSGLAAGLVDDGISGLRQLPLTHLAFQPGAQSSFSRSTLDADDLAPWAEADGVEAAPLGVSFFNLRTTDGDTLDVALFGTPADSFLAPDQRARDALAGPPGIVLSHDLIESGVEVGDELTVVGPDITLPVLGFTYTGSYGHVEIALTSLGTWQELVYGDAARGRFSAIALRGDTSTFDDLTEASGTTVETKVQAYRGSPGYAAETATMSLIRGFLLLISALVVAAFFTVWTVQRTQEIGLLKALGASNRYVIRDALGQLAVVLVASASVGAIVAAVVGRFVSSAVPFSLEAATVATGVVILVVVGLLGSLVALRRITRIDPALALVAT